MRCGRELPAHSQAAWDREAKRATCRDCLGVVEPEPASPASQATTEVDPPRQSLHRGTPGASARRRYEHLHDRRDRQARERLGRRVGGLYLALTTEPQSTTAWARGGRGEELLGGYLETLHDERSVIVLHDRRIPRTRANIDHIVVTRSGIVWAVDAKNYTGKVQRIDRGGWFTTDYRLSVGRRDCTKLVHGMAKQVEAIRQALGEPLIEEFNVRVRAGLCFVNAEWALFAKPFWLDDVWIGWSKALGNEVTAGGELAPEHLMTLARRVADALPAA
jgi:hypothetical protein